MRRVTFPSGRRLPGVTRHDTAGAQLRLLVGALVLIAALLTVATVAATQLWLSLTVSVVLLAVAAAGLRYGVPRVLVLVTLGFVAVLLGSAAMQWSAAPAPVSAGLDSATPALARAPGPTLISGTVSESGRPLAGVPVQVTLLPRMNDAEVGESLDLTQLDPVLTDEQGRYVVTLALADVDPSSLLPGRALNFEVGLVDPMLNPVSTSARFPRRGSDWVDVFDDRRGEPKTLDFDLGAMKATETGAGARHRWPLFRL